MAGCQHDPARRVEGEGEVTATPTIWEGCYESNWKGIITPDSFSHPAKMSRSLLTRIIRHGFEQGYWEVGSLIGDCFGGATHANPDFMENQNTQSAVRCKDGLEHPANDLRLRRDLSAEKSEPVQNRETPRSLEIERVKRCMANTANEIQRVEGVLAQMRQKQIARTREVAIQETLARCSNAPHKPRGETP